MVESILVKVAPLGRCVCEVSVPSGSVVSTVLEAASKRTNVAGYEDLRRNGNTTNLPEPVQGGDIITLVPQIRGGQ
jgi:hypothetical protein